MTEICGVAEVNSHACGAAPGEEEEEGTFQPPQARLGVVEETAFPDTSTVWFALQHLMCESISQIKWPSLWGSGEHLIL